MKTIILKFVSWLLRRGNKNSHFYMVSQSGNKTYVFIDGKRMMPVNYISGNPLSESEQGELSEILNTYFKLVNKQEDKK